MDVIRRHDLIDQHKECAHVQLSRCVRGESGENHPMALLVRI